MSQDKLLRKLKTQKVMRVGELEEFISHRNQLGPLADQGKIVALGSGFYAHPSLDPFVASVIAVARYFPKAIISNVTALAIYDLTDERVDKIDIDIERNTSIRNKLVKAHRVAKTRMIGVIKLDYYGEKIRIYDVERSLCDAYRFDPGAIFLKAMKRYVRLGQIDTERIGSYDRKLKTQVLKALMQELADG